jgi:hypothetical protein
MALLLGDFLVTPILVLQPAQALVSLAPPPTHLQLTLNLRCACAERDVRKHFCLPRRRLSSRTMNILE